MLGASCHAYCHKVCRSVRKCTEVKTAKSVCTEVYRSVRVLRRLNGVQEVASSNRGPELGEAHVAAPISKKRATMRAFAPVNVTVSASLVSGRERFRLAS